MEKVGAEARDADREASAPVVADEVDGLADLLELADQPVDVFLLRRAEAGRPRAAEAGEREGDHVVPG